MSEDEKRSSARKGILIRSFILAERRTHMRSVLTCLSRISAFARKRTIFTIVLGLSIASSVYAQDIVVSEKDFTCIRDGHHIRNTFIRHSDPEKLIDAMRILEIIESESDI